MAPTARRKLANPPSEQSTSLAAVVERVEEDIVLGRLHPRERLIEDDGYEGPSRANIMADTVVPLQRRISRRRTVA